VKLKDALAVLIVGDEPTSSMRVEEDSIFLSSISISNYLEQWYSNPLESGQAYWRTLREDYTSNPRPRIVTALTHTAKLRYFSLLRALIRFYGISLLKSSPEYFILRLCPCLYFSQPLADISWS
jgi:hypothetical protein